MRPWSSTRGLSVGPLSLNSLSASQQPFLAFSPSLSLSLSLSSVILRCTGPRVRPGDRAKSRREEEEEEERRGGLRRHGYRNHDLAVSTLHGSTRYLPGHLHIKLTHNARHISGSAVRCCAPSNEPARPNERAEGVQEERVVRR